MSAHETASLGNSVPGARALADAILANHSIQDLNQNLWIFSVVETLHLLFMTTLGGATLVLALRVLGVALPDVTPVDLERITRPWLRWATLGGLLSGIFMSIATVVTLVENSSFVVKLLALVAAILFGFALSERLRGGNRLVQRGLAFLGVLLIIRSLWLFFSTGILHYGAIVVVSVVGIFLALSFIARARKAEAEDGDLAAQLLATGTVLAWTTVIIAARWIGFS